MLPDPFVYLGNKKETSFELDNHQGPKGPRVVKVLLHLCYPEVHWSVNAARRAGGSEMHKGEIRCHLYTGTENQKHLGNTDHFSVATVHVLSSNQSIIAIV